MRRLDWPARLVLLLPLLAGGCQGWRDVVMPQPFPDRATSADTATACPDWRAARVAHPLDSVRGNQMPAHDVPLGCALDANLRAQAARPADLTPEAGNRPLPPAEGAYAGAAVGRYRADTQKPLPRRTAEVGKN